MRETYKIPLAYGEGTYGIGELCAENKEIMELNYINYGDIVTYELPDSEYGGKTITLYGIPKNVLENTLQATYDTNGQLKMLTIQKNDKEVLLYIHYKDAEDARQVIEAFAVTNAKVILEKIAMCKEPVSRLFVEYFNDGQYMDFHAKLGTESEKFDLEKEYPEYDDIADSCGDYSSEILAGDNDRLAILVSCANNDKENFFQYAVDVMVQLVEGQGDSLLNKAVDFRFMCQEYD